MTDHLADSALDHPDPPASHPGVKAEQGENDTASQLPQDWPEPEPQP